MPQMLNHSKDHISYHNESLLRSVNPKSNKCEVTPCASSKCQYNNGDTSTYFNYKMASSYILNIVLSRQNEVHPKGEMRLLNFYEEFTTM